MCANLKIHSRVVAPKTNTGAVLLEVILALVLFVAAATIIGGALNSSTTGVERLRQSVHGANLASSVLAEIQMGARSTAETGPEPFEPPFESWMWQVQATPVEEKTEASDSAGLVQVNVVVRDTETEFVHRLTQTLPVSSVLIEIGSKTALSEY